MKDFVLKTLDEQGYKVDLMSEEDERVYINASNENMYLFMVFGNLNIFYTFTAFDKKGEITKSFYHADRIMNDVIHEENKLIDSLGRYLTVFNKTYNFLKEEIGL